MRSLAVVVAVATAASQPAAAQSDPDEFPGGEFFYDAGAIAGVYVPLALVAVAELGFDPPETPRLFSESEGGEADFDNTVPEPYVAIGGAAIAAAIFSLSSEGRWFHVKGMGQAVSITLALTSIGKNVFGRHRPHWSLETTGDRDTRRSFPSGHSSTALSIATYSCLFLNREGPRLVPGLACAGIIGTAAFTAYSRVRDNRHHLTDVITGGLIGAGVSVAMFLYQESRYSDRKAEAGLL